MATETLNININQRGGRQTTKTMVGLGAAMAAVGYAAVRAGRTFVKSADDMTRLRNQTKVFAKDQGDAAYRMQETVRIARDMNQSLNTVGQVMQRVSLAQESAGISTEQTVKIVENLSKAVALSGATSQEAEGALRQFAQGLAANRLSGQELNSVLEQTPLVAAVLADSIGPNGVAVGSLRALGEAGLLTTEVLVKAFGSEIPKLAEMMAKFEFPLESLFTSIQREATIFIDKMGELSGATGMFRKIVEGVVTKLTDLNEMLEKGGPKADQFARAMNAIATGLGAVAAVGAAAVFFAMINPITILATAAGTLVALFTYFKDETFEIGDASADLGAIVHVLANDFKLMAKWSLAAGRALVKGIGEQISPLIDGIKDIIISAHMMKSALSDPFGDWDLTSLYADANKVVSGMGGMFDGLFSMEHFMEQVEGSFGGLTERAEAWRKNNPMSKPASIAREVIPVGAEAGEGKGTVNPKIKGWQDDYDSVLASLDPLVALQQEHEKSLLAVNTAKVNGLVTDEEYVRTLGLLADETARLMDEANFDKFVGMEAARAGAAKGFSDFFEGLGSQAQAWADGIGGAFNMAADAMTNFMTTGKMDFKAFARDMINMIMKIVMKLLLMKALSGIAGGMAGSSSSFISGIGSGMLDIMNGERATGGPVASGKPYLVGEKGPELFVPPSSGSIKNATATAGMAPQNNITVVNVDDPKSVPNAMNTEAGEEVILNIISRNPEILRELG
jgi:tape measure domain-containing protein